MSPKFGTLAWSTDAEWISRQLFTSTQVELMLRCRPNIVFGGTLQFFLLRHVTTLTLTSQLFGIYCSRHLLASKSASSRLAEAKGPIEYDLIPLESTQVLCSAENADKTLKAKRRFELATEGISLHPSFPRLK